MANKVHNMESHAYALKTGKDSVGSYMQYENGVKNYAFTTALTDGLATTAVVGSFATTSHATGRGKMFTSDGSAWQDINV